MTSTEPKLTRFPALEDRELVLSAKDQLRKDAVPPSAIFYEEGREDLGAEPLSKECYVSRDYVRKEFDAVWSKVWQMACRETQLRQPGDFVTYQISDQSVLITRDREGELKAFHNVCLHRGTRLMEGRGTVGGGGAFSCPYHAWTWGLDGALQNVPCAWDFPKLEPSKYGLRPVQVDTWDGWVFINFDLDAASLTDYLGDVVPRHFAEWPMRNRRIAAYGAKIIPANWKAALEAFMEVYHVFRTHPQTNTPGLTPTTNYDQWGYHARMLQTVVPDPHYPAGPPTIEEYLESMEIMGAPPNDDAPVLEAREGESLRAFMARSRRVALSKEYRTDLSATSDAEVLDVIEYFLFPNFIPWGAYGNPLVYRARPNGDDPDSCVFETMLVVPAGGDPEPDVEMTVIASDASWTEVPNMGFYGPILDQDDSNLKRVQAGLHSTGVEQVSFSEVQEGNIRVLHKGVTDHIERYAH